MEKARQKLSQILSQHQILFVTATLQQLKRENCNTSKRNENFIKWTSTLMWLSVGIFCFNYYYIEQQEQRCALSVPRSLSYVFRPPESCDFCSNIKSVPHLNNLSPAMFETNYAYSGAPIVVSDALRNWTATTLFNYQYFQNAYQKAKRKQRLRHCQFLPYKTGFQDIYEALEMPKARVEMGVGEAPWYFGWSNCHSETTEQFRKHYAKPYFLPYDSENKAVDWIFIGTSGMGAQMHIDNVRLPSWQAQLAGSKQWLLVPPPECYFQCRRFEVVVQQGDIIVLDTNRWYHQTNVLPGAVSITIGAEYD